MLSVKESVLDMVQGCEGNGVVSGGNSGDDAGLLRHCEDLYEIAAQIKDASEKEGDGEVAGEEIAEPLALSEGQGELYGLWDRTARAVASISANGRAGLVAKRSALVLCLDVEERLGDRSETLSQSFFADFDRLVAEPASGAE